MDRALPPAGQSQPEALIPSADEIVAYLRGGYGEFCIQMPEGILLDPPEIWIGALGCWVRASDCSVSGDYGRGRRHYGRLGRWRIRRAIRRFTQLRDDMNALWERSLAASAMSACGQDPKGLEAKPASADPQGDAQQNPEPSQ